MIILNNQCALLSESAARRGLVKQENRNKQAGARCRHADTAGNAIAALPVIAGPNHQHDE